MADDEAELFGRLQDGRRWRGARRHDGDGAIKLYSGLCRTLDQHAEHGRRAAHMRHAMLADGVEDFRRLHFPQANMRAADCSHAPGKAPAVDVEHRQRPEITESLLSW